MPAWDMNFDDAMAEAKRSGIDPEDAAEMWRRYNELGDEVRAGTKSDADALNEFGAFGSRLARLRYLKRIMSPDLDVITGRFR